MRKGRIDFYPDDWKDLPIFEANSIEQDSLSELSKSRIQQENLLQSVSLNFIELLKSDFSLEKRVKRLRIGTLLIGMNLRKS